MLRITVHENLKPDILARRMERIKEAYWSNAEISVCLDEDLTELVVQEKGENTLRLFIEGYDLGRGMSHD